MQLSTDRRDVNGYKESLENFNSQLGNFINELKEDIFIAGISVFCPEKRDVLSRLASRGMIDGLCVSLLSSLIVGLIMTIWLSLF